MCLAVLAIADINPSDTGHHQTEDWLWIVVANRDETHARPSTDMQPWTEDSRILAGRDLQAGGTWLGVHSDGRFGLLTNYREPGKQRIGTPSRGYLVEQFLRQDVTPESYLRSLQIDSAAYNGFNILAGQHGRWWHASNRADAWMRAIQPRVPPSHDQPSRRIRVHGLSNALLDTPWPKVRRTCDAVGALLEQGCTDFDKLSAIMQDAEPAPDAELPDTGLALERERMVSSPFIRSPGYGTRCTTVVMQLADASIVAQEITYQADGSERSRSRWISNAPGWRAF